MENTVVKTKFCKFCGEKIAEDAVMCIHCGKQVETLNTVQPQVVINNNNSNTNVNSNTNINRAVNTYGIEKNKWIALFLCIFLGCLGVHKFYEGKIGMGILYLCTVGLCGIGWIVDIIVLILKPNPYYV